VILGSGLPALGSRDPHLPSLGDAITSLLSSQTPFFQVLRTALTRPAQVIQEKVEIAHTIPSAERRPPALYLGNGTVLATLRDGQKIFLDGSDISLTPHLALDGYWEEWITKVFLDTVKPGMTIVDIGANCGYYSLLGARAVGPKGYTIAIDANPKMCSLIDSSLATNGYSSRSTVINAAVTAAHGEVNLSIPEKYKGGATIHGMDSRYSPNVITVAGTPLSSLVGDRSIDFIKIDAEGAEPLVFQGSEDLFARLRKLSVIMEFAPSHFVSILSGAEFLNYLARLGFNLSLIRHDGTTKISSKSEILEKTHCDLLLTKH
jgi:FkbM family methyltransferase